MNRSLQSKFWKLSEEISQAKDYYKFLDHKVVSKVEELYKTEKFANQRALDQDDARNAPVIFENNSSIIKISRFKPLFNTFETELHLENLSKEHLFFQSKNLFEKGQELIFEIPFEKNVYILCKIDYHIRKNFLYLYRTQIVPAKSYGYQYFLKNIRKTTEKTAN